MIGKSGKFFWVMVLLLGLAVAAAGAEPATLRILYLNDFHGYADSFQPPGWDHPVGGASYLAGVVNQLRREKPTLLLAAGDMISGNIWANFTKGRSVIKLLNAMRVSAMVVGNHEFDYGPQVLKHRVAEAKFPVLGANVTGLPGLKPYVVKTLAGVKVAIIGVVTEDTPVLTYPQNVRGLKFRPAAETVPKYIAEVKRKADLIVVLSHLGYYADWELAARVKGIGVIIGGHSHTKLTEPVPVNGTLIVQAWEYGKVLGVLDLTLDRGKITAATGWLVEINPGKDRDLRDRTIEALVTKYDRRLDALQNKKIGYTRRDLVAENLRKQETNLGDLVADIMREATGAEVAVINSGAIRMGISRGVIRYKDLYAALPFDNYLVTLTLTGRQLREVLEHGLTRIPEGAGSFLQVAGLHLTYEPSAPPGQRLREVKIGPRPLDPEEKYTVATIDFLVAGGDGFKTFPEVVAAAVDGAGARSKKGGRAGLVKKRWLREVVAAYLQCKGTIDPKTDGRIKEVDAPPATF